jgi:hypothetical protein
MAMGKITGVCNNVLHLALTNNIRSAYCCFHHNVDIHQLEFENIFSLRVTFLRRSDTIAIDSHL